MPINTERQEPGIYVAHWRGIVRMEEVYISADDMQALADEDGITRYVVILDGRELDSIPVQIRAYRKSIKPNVIATLITEAPHMAKMVGEIVSQAYPVTITFFDDMTVAVSHAQLLLAEDAE